MSLYRAFIIEVYCKGVGSYFNPKDKKVESFYNFIILRNIAMFKRKQGLPVRRTQTGFTLIELLVVIAIIGILSSVVLASLNTAREKSRDARRVSDIKQLQLALELYFDSNGSYATGTSNIVALDKLVTGGFIAQIATDPVSGDYYSYSADATPTATNYHLGAALEDTSHTALPGAVFDSAAYLSGTPFNGASADCSTSVTAAEGCYDVTP